ncbi:MAG: hypothetical protein WA138_16360 [Parvibaculum sp.]
MRVGLLFAYFHGDSKNMGGAVVISGELITLVLLGIGTVFGYFLQHYLERRKELEIQRIVDRRDHYRNLVLCLKSISEGKRDNDELLRFEYAFLWLYAPDSVILSFNHLICRLNSGDDIQMVDAEVGELILAMRRDLGFERTQLLSSEFELQIN